jgi:hypothetical protein
MAYGRQALALASKLGEGRLEAMANRVVGNLLVRGNELPKGIPLLERAFQLSLAADDPAEAAECCACLTMAYFWSGRMHQTKEILLRRIGLAHLCQELYHQSTSKCMSRTPVAGQSLTSILRNNQKSRCAVFQNDC